MKCQLYISTLIVFITGCATIDTDIGCSDSLFSTSCESSIVSLPILDNKPSITNGVVYSLPVQDVELSIENKLLTKDKLLKEKRVLTSSTDKIQSEIKILKQEKKSIEEFIAKLPPDKERLSKKKSDELTTVTINIAKKQTRLRELKSKIALKKSEIESLPASGKGFKFKASLKPLDPLPDPNATLSAISIDSTYSSETVEIKTTSSGLLSGGSGTSKGKVDEIFISLASAVGAFKGESFIDQLPEVGFEIQSMSITTTDDEVQEQKCVQEEFKKKFNLAPHGTPTELLEEVNEYFLSNSYCFKALSTSTEVFTQGYKEALATNKKTYIDGLVYPRQSTFEISICETREIKKSNPELLCDKAKAIKTKSLSASIISPNNLGVLKMKQGFFADNSYEYEFSNGLLTRFKSDKGNELVSFFAMFPEAAKALVSIPAEIIQLKFDLSDKEKAYYEAQTEILKQKIKYDHYSNNPDAVITEESEDSGDSSGE